MTMESFWLAVTTLGRDEVFIVALALYTWLVRPQGGRDLGVAFALSYLVNSGLKYGLDLPRPFVAQPELASEAAKATAGGPGLPSGHAQMAATLWGGIAIQVGRRGVWIAAVALIGLIAVSRLALQVHYPSDVIVGLLLGGLFALSARHGYFPQHDWTRLALPLVLLAVAALLPSSTPRELGAGLGMLAGFWYARPSFVPPREWTGRLVVALLGLVMVFAVYFGLSALPEEVRNLGLVRALRYALLVVVAVQGVPFVLRRWMPQSGPQLSPMRTPAQV